MISSLSTSASPSESSRAHRQSSAALRADRAGPDHVKVPRRKQRVAPAPDVAQDRGLKFRHDVRERPPTLPPRRLYQSTLCRKTAPAVSACLTITTSTQSTHRQGRGSSSFAYSDLSFFNRGQKRMTSQASMWKLGEVRSNAKGGKFLCLEPLSWRIGSRYEVDRPRTALALVLGLPGTPSSLAPGWPNWTFALHGQQFLKNAQGTTCPTGRWSSPSAARRPSTSSDARRARAFRDRREERLQPARVRQRLADWRKGIPPDCRPSRTNPSEQKPSTCGEIEEALAVRLQVEQSKTRELLTLSLEGVSQMAYIVPERLTALVRPAFDLVLRRIRSLKRCVQA